MVVLIRYGLTIKHWSTLVMTDVMGDGMVVVVTTLNQIVDHLLVLTIRSSTIDE